MKKRNPSEILEEFSNHCIQCEVCLNACDLLNELGLMPGEIAQAVQNGEIDEKLIAAVQRCALCGYCSQDCPVDLEPAELMEAAREVFMQSGLVTPQDFEVMLMDRKWNAFSLYRETYGIDYSDLNESVYEALFFPGCSLAAYAPEITRAAHHWLLQQGIQLGFTEMCCGVPLESIGLSAEAGRHLDRLHDMLKSAGAKRIITACPHCESHLKAHLSDIEIKSIYGLMSDAEICLEGSSILTFHDSCPDRYNLENLKNNRMLFSGYPTIEMASHGENTICCGSGGIVSMVDPDLCVCRAQKRIAEFKDSGADVCLTGCMACAHRLARVGQPGQVKHILEYFFDCQIDYDKIEENTRAMWEGEVGQVNIQRLSQNGAVKEKERNPSGSS